MRENSVRLILSVLGIKVSSRSVLTMLLWTMHSSPLTLLNAELNSQATLLPTMREIWIQISFLLNEYNHYFRIFY